MSSSLEQTGTLLSRDGTRLFYREWLAENPRAAVQIVHGLGEHSGRYVHVAKRLNAHGISVRAHDHRGHGRSDGRRGALGTRLDLVNHLKLVFEDFARQQRTTPFLLGHSLGGLVAAYYATHGISPVRGLILSSPALAIRMSLAQRILLAVTGRIAPRLQVNNGLDVNALSHDAAVVAAYRADPLNHDRVTPGLVRFMLDAIPAVVARAPALPMSALLLVAGADRLVLAEGSRRFAELLPPGRGTLRWYDDAFHEIFNETPARRAHALEDLMVWIDAQMAG
jgi:alpha-beta hydrolase superfamily lysophospholipase